jgi:hypothetical protein
MKGVTTTHTIRAPATNGYFVGVFTPQVCHRKNEQSWARQGLNFLRRIDRHLPTDLCRKLKRYRPRPLPLKKKVFERVPSGLRGEMDEYLLGFFSNMNLEKRRRRLFFR